MGETPLYDAVKGFAIKENIRFCMPSHKGKDIGSVFDTVFPYDLTELNETDNLYISNGVIGQAEDLAAKAFKAKSTCFCASGASACVKAMLLLCAKPNDTIIADRMCHHSAVDAMALLDLNPVWLYPDIMDGFGIPAPPTIGGIKKALEIAKNPSCVFITSPNYYGLTADIKEISAFLHEKNTPLLIDNAHGAHLAFIDGGKQHPISQGASLVTDSAHKTLPVLTGGAFLHINTDKITRTEALSAISMFSTSSPSYLIMASLDYARDWAENNTEAFAKTIELCNQAKQQINSIGFSCLDTENSDKLRLTINTSTAGINGKKAYDYLYSKGIICEMADYRNIVLIISPLNTKEEFAILINTLQELYNTEKSKETGLLSFPIIKTQSAMSIRQAVFSQKKEIEIEKCIGFISGETITVYPPSVPLLVAGEVITEKTAKLINEYTGRKYIKIVTDT